MKTRLSTWERINRSLSFRFPTIEHALSASPVEREIIETARIKASLTSLYNLRRDVCSPNAEQYTSSVEFYLAKLSSDINWLVWDRLRRRGQLPASCKRHRGKYLPTVDYRAVERQMRAKA